MATRLRRTGSRGAQLRRIAQRIARPLPDPAPTPEPEPTPAATPLAPAPAADPQLAPAPAPSAPTGEATSWWTRLQQTVAMLATAATLAVAAFTWISIRQVNSEQDITREGQITDRYNTAVSDLGSSSAAVRIGSIYGLQRIMRDSPRDQPAIISVLTNYVRTRSPARNTPGEPPDDKYPPSSGTAPDISAALTVLATRNPHNDQGVKINLESVELSDINLPGINFRGFDLTGADLRYANLPGANLTGANLTSADLYETNLRRANLDSVNMDSALLFDAFLTAANLRGANLLAVNMDGASLHGADLRDADLTNVQMYHTLLTAADLRGANLTGADVGDAKPGVNLTGAKRGSGPTVNPW